MELTMKHPSPTGRDTARWPGLMTATVLAFATIVCGSEPGRAEDNGASKILRAMSDYVAKQKSISATFDTDVEVITNDLQKIQFASSGTMQMVRPDKLWVSRVGGYTDVDLVFDGQKTALLGRNNNIFTEINSPGSVAQLVDRLRDEYQVAIPGADLLLGSNYERLMDGVIDAKHVGQGVIDGVDCEHLAFRNMDTDWQIWIEAGPNPIPRKYVITSKAVASAPQYTLRIKNWSTDAQVSADAFAFKAPADSKKVDIKELRDIDDVPSGTITGSAR
jgi:hypothetical protein